MRNLIAALLLSTTFAAAQTAAQPAAPLAPAGPTFTLHKLAEGVYAAVTIDGKGAGGNAGFMIGDDGVLVIDSFTPESSARELLAEIRKLTPLPVRYLVNTHYHMDHTGGNGVYAQAGAAIIAHPNVRTWLRTENMKFFGPNATPEQKSRVESLTLPSIVYHGAGLDIYLGNRQVLLRFDPGHTGGDTLIAVPDAKVVFGGDLLWNARFPNMMDASTGPWIETLDTLIAAHPDFTFVPGHGEVGGVDFLRAQRDYFNDLRKAVSDARASGKSPADLVAAIQPQLAKGREPWGFQRFLPLNIQQQAAEQAGAKKVPQP